MLPGDNNFSAMSSAKTYFGDTSVQQYHDPERRAGKAFGVAMGAEKDKVAWDIYMFFDTGVEWEKKAPVPKAHVHQLKGSSWAPEETYTSGRAIFEDLYRAAREDMQ